MGMQTHLNWQSITKDSGLISTGGLGVQPISPSDGPLKPIAISEAIEVVRRAVEAYTASTASMRGTRSSLRHIYYPHGEGKVRYTGPTAEDILEDYLAGLGYKRGSQMWFDLSRIVIEHAEQQIKEEPELAFWCALNRVPFEP